jgi:hypothetical protein
LNAICGSQEESAMIYCTFFMYHGTFFHLQPGGRNRVCSGDYIVNC